VIGQDFTIPQASAKGHSVVQSVCGVLNNILAYKKTV